MIKSFKCVLLSIGLFLFVRCECNGKNQELDIKEQLKLHSQKELDENEKLSHEVLKIVNELRTNPLVFRGYLTSLRDKFSNGSNSYRTTINGQTVIMNTNEGVAAVNVAIDYIDTKFPTGLKPLNYNRILDKSSLLMAKYMSKYNFWDHKNNAIPEFVDHGKRIKQYCKKWTKCSENLWRGTLSKDMSLKKKAIDIIVGLFVDDGVPTRGHRDNLVAPDMTDLGNGLWQYGEGEYKRQSIFVMNFGAGIEE